MACLYAGICLFWSDHLRREAEWAEKSMMLEAYRLSTVEEIAERLEVKEQV
jgi:hypothetical protein